MFLRLRRNKDKSSIKPYVPARTSFPDINSDTINLSTLFVFLNSHFSLEKKTLKIKLNKLSVLLAFKSCENSSIFTSRFSPLNQYTKWLLEATKNFRFISKKKNPKKNKKFKNFFLHRTKTIVYLFCFCLKKL